MLSSGGLAAGEFMMAGQDPDEILAVAAAVVLGAGIPEAEPAAGADESGDDAALTLAASSISLSADSALPAAPAITGDTLVNVNHAMVVETTSANVSFTVYDGTAVVGTGVAGVFSPMSAPFDPVVGTPYVIVLENEQAGTPMRAWLVNPGGDSTLIEGFARQIGANVGGTVQFKPSATATSSFIDARFAATGGLAGTPSNALTGQVISIDPARDDTITLTYGQTQLSIWRNTAIQQTSNQARRRR